MGSGGRIAYIFLSLISADAAFAQEDLSPWIAGEATTAGELTDEFQSLCKTRLTENLPKLGRDASKADPICKCVTAFLTKDSDLVSLQAMTAILSGRAGDPKSYPHDFGIILDGVDSATDNCETKEHWRDRPFNPQKAPTNTPE